MQFQNILVVCIGNICRSPMAEYMLQRELPQLKFSSAGIAGLEGHAADSKAQYCMQALGIDMSSHIGRRLSTQMLKDADLVLVMSQKQQQHIEQTWPFSKGKTFRLGHWKNIDIADPYQKDQTVFDHTCQLIQQCITDWKQHL